jgi:hypothetical protein
MSGRRLDFTVEVSEDQDVYLVDGIRVPRIVARDGDVVVLKVKTEGYPLHITTSAIGNDGGDGVEDGIIEFVAHRGKQYYYQCTKARQMGHKIVVLDSSK